MTGGVDDNSDAHPGLKYGRYAHATIRATITIPPVPLFILLPAAVRLKVNRYD